MNFYRLNIAMSFAALVLAGPAVAQQPAPATPPELKDFRLDKPPAEQPKAEPPKIEPPAAVTPKFEPPKPETALATPQARTAKPDRHARKIEEAPVNRINRPREAKLDSKIEAVAPAPASDATTPSAAPIEPAGDIVSTAPTALPWQWFVGGALLVLAGLFAVLIRRRTLAKRADYLDEDYDPETPDIADDGHLLELDETAVVPAPSPDKPTPVLELTEHDPGEMRANFEPSFASLSMANLTVTGKLTITNPGKQPIGGLKVRTLMMSACENQKATIDAFHDDRSRGHSEDIGDALAGEQIALALEIQVPRSDMQAFDWRERRFVAPIVLINLIGRSADGPHECRLSCLLGREAVPPTPRMKPFHIDRGPRRFDGLGIRPAGAFA